MLLGPKVTSTIASATTGDYKSLSPVPKCGGAKALLLRVWQNSTGAGDRTIDAVLAYPAGPDGTTISVKGWSAQAWLAHASGVTATTPAKASVADVAPASAGMFLIPLTTNAVPCVFPVIIPSLHFTGGSVDTTLLVIEAWPVYLDGESPFGLGSSASPF
jgi:hypothetical protein